MVLFLCSTVYGEGRSGPERRTKTNLQKSTVLTVEGRVVSYRNVGRKVSSPPTLLRDWCLFEQRQIVFALPRPTVDDDVRECLYPW